MIPLRDLYLIVGVTMASLLASMVLDPIVPTFQSLWLSAVANPIFAYVGVIALMLFVFDSSTRAGTETLFTLALITLFVVLVNEALVSIVGSGALSVEIAALAALSLKVKWGWAIVAASGIAAVLAGTLLLSSLILTIVTGGGIAILIGGASDA